MSSPNSTSVIVDYEYQQRGGKSTGYNPEIIVVPATSYAGSINNKLYGAFVEKDNPTNLLYTFTNSSGTTSVTSPSPLSGVIQVQTAGQVKTVNGTNIFSICVSPNVAITPPTVGGGAGQIPATSEIRIRPAQTDTNNPSGTFRSMRKLPAPNSQLGYPLFDAEIITASPGTPSSFTGTTIPVKARMMGDGNLALLTTNIAGASSGNLIATYTPLTYTILAGLINVGPPDVPFSIKVSGSYLS